VSSSISNPYTLLVAVVLSAQGDRRGVNKADARAVRGGRYAAKDAGTRRGKSPRIHQDIGLYRNKAKNVIALSEN